MSTKNTASAETPAEAPVEMTAAEEIAALKAEIAKKDAALAKANKQNTATGTVVKAEAPKIEKMTIPRGSKSERNYEIISINGINYKIMKGVEVEVPDFVKEVYDNSVAQLEEAYDYETKKENEFQEAQNKLG